MHFKDAASCFSKYLAHTLRQTPTEAQTETARHTLMLTQRVSEAWCGKSLCGTKEEFGCIPHLPPVPATSDLPGGLFHSCYGMDDSERGAGGGRRPFETRISAPVTPRAATKVYFLHSFSILSTPGVMYATANKHLDVLHTHILTLHFVSKNIRNISRCSELLFLLWFYPSLTLITIQLPLVSISAENTASPLAAPIISYTSLPLEEWEILFGAWHPFIPRRSETATVRMCVRRMWETGGLKPWKQPSEAEAEQNLCIL